jgi:gas vesicle protein
VTEIVAVLVIGLVAAAIGSAVGMLVAPRVGRWAERDRESDDD